MSVACAFSKVIVMRCCGLQWEECVQCVMRIVRSQSLADQADSSCSACSVAETHRLVEHRSQL